MNIIVLGGSNDTEENLNLFTKHRCEKANFLLNEKQEKCNIHFSGGFNKKFNNTNISHAIICKKYFLTLNYNVLENQLFLHEENNNTVDEAIHFGNYFKQNHYEEIIIITNDWHYNRVKYLFEKVFNFYKIKNYEIIGVESKSNIELIEKEETEKLEQLKKNPYGKWKSWLINNNFNY